MVALLKVSFRKSICAGFEDLVERDILAAPGFPPMPSARPSAAAVRIFDQVDRRRHERDFGDAGFAAEDAPKAVAGADFRRGDDRSWPFACTFRPRTVIFLNGWTEMSVTVTSA